VNYCLFDAGTLAAVERRDLKMIKRMLFLLEEGVTIVVPSVVLGTWWQGSDPWREHIYASLLIESLDAPMAKLAGEAMRAVKGTLFEDAISMAYASKYSCVLYTPSPKKYAKLQARFSHARVRSIL
jgi:hypothetical protein